MEAAVVPVIALPPEAAGEKAVVEAARAIDEACRDVGFFAVTNHGVPDAVVQAAWQATRQFFDGALEEKMSVRMPYKGYPYGYSGLCSEALSKSQGDYTPPDLKETFSRIETYMYEWKFDGASSGLLNANIIARDLQLAEHTVAKLDVQTAPKVDPATVADKMHPDCTDEFLAAIYAAGLEPIKYSQEQLDAGVPFYVPGGLNLESGS